MEDLLQRRMLHANNTKKADKLSLELQLENHKHILSQEVADKNQQLRKMKGEELHGLNLEELQQLENVLEAGLRRVIRRKDEQYQMEINALKEKGAQLTERNLELKHKLAMATSTIDKSAAVAAPSWDAIVHEEGQSAESIEANVCSSGTDQTPPPEDDSSDTSLKLGLSFWS